MMRRLFLAVAVFFVVGFALLALICGVAYAEVIEIKELKATINIEEGWVYSGNGMEDGIFIGSDTSSWPCLFLSF